MYTKNNLSLNYDRTKYQIFHKVNHPIPSVYVNRPLSLDSGHVIEQVTSFKYLYLYGLKRYLTDIVMQIMLNSHVNSISDYCIDIWATLTTPQLVTIQNKVDRFLVNFYLPAIAKKIRLHKSQYYKDFRHNINIVELHTKCKSLTLIERRDLFLLKHAYNNLLHTKTVSSSRRSFPLLSLPVARTTIAQKNINFRAAKL